MSYLIAAPCLSSSTSSSITNTSPLHFWHYLLQSTVFNLSKVFGCLWVSLGIWLLLGYPVGAFWLYPPICEQLKSPLSRNLPLGLSLSNSASYSWLLSLLSERLVLVSLPFSAWLRYLPLRLCLVWRSVLTRLPFVQYSGHPFQQFPFRLYFDKSSFS